MNETENSRLNGHGARLVAAAMVALFAGAALTQAGVQVVRRQQVLDMAKDGDKDYVTRMEPARRGEITTRDGKLVAANVNDYEIGLSYKLCPKSEGFFLDLANSTGLNVADVASAPLQGQTYRSWVQRMSREQVQDIKRIQKEWKADGLTVRPIEAREYPMGEQFSGLVGVVRGGAPVSGLERGLDTTLSGKPGKLVGFQDRNGLFVQSEEAVSVEPTNGKSIGLTIDSSLQSVAFDAVKSAVVAHKATSGCAIVIDPKNGDVLAQANWPAFDPSGNLDPNLTFSSSYMAALEPGSTFKILTLAKAMDAGKVDASWHDFCTGELSVDGKHSVKCDSHHGTSGAHGNVDMVKAIAVSCNTSAAKWSLSLGRQTMTDYMKQLGLVGKPGLNLPGESAGGFNAKDTSRMQTANFGFGQAMACSPVSLAAAFAMIGNHGRYVKPRLVRSIDGVDQPSANGVPVVRPDTADSVLKTMESVIQSDYGTGASLKIPGYRLAGKTGTAQKLKGSKTVGYVSNFVGFVPASHPKACVLVMIDDPKQGYYGAVVAGPVFTEIAKAVLRRNPVEMEGREAIESSALRVAETKHSYDGLTKGLSAGLVAQSSQNLMFQQAEVPTKFNEEGSVTVEKEGKGASTTVVKAAQKAASATGKNAQKVAKKIQKTDPSRAQRLAEQLQTEAYLDSMTGTTSKSTTKITAGRKIKKSPTATNVKPTVAPVNVATKTSKVKNAVAHEIQKIAAPMKTIRKKKPAATTSGETVVLQAKRRAVKPAKSVTKPAPKTTPGTTKKVGTSLKSALKKSLQDGTLNP